MLIIQQQEVVASSGHQLIYHDLIPWQHVSGVNRWVIDAEHGQAFIDSDGTEYLLRRRSEAELQAVIAPEVKAQQEIERIAQMIEALRPQEIRLNTNGDVCVKHHIQSLWYSVTVIPVRVLMSGLYVEKKKHVCRIRGGIAGGKVLCRFEALLPQTRQKNRIFLHP